eukprot:102549_1
MDGWWMDGRIVLLHHCNDFGDGLLVMNGFLDHCSDFGDGLHVMNGLLVMNGFLDHSNHIGILVAQLLFLSRYCQNNIDYLNLDYHNADYHWEAYSQSPSSVLMMTSSQLEKTSNKKK